MSKQEQRTNPNLIINYETAEKIAKEGLPGYLIDRLKRGELNELDEKQQREVIGRACLVAAERHEELRNEGVLVEKIFGLNDPKMEEAAEDLSKILRRKAQNIINNKETPLKDQI